MLPQSGLRSQSQLEAEIKNSMYLAHPLLNLHQLPVYPSSPLTQLDLPRVIDEDVGSLGTREGIRSRQRTSFPRAPLLPHL